MPITFENAKQIFEKSLEALIKSDAQLIYDGTSERSICSRLACYIEKIAHQEFNLENYYADTEYNRKQDGLVKTILPNSKTEPVNVVCDLILHSRGQQSPKDNLIALEMKKSNRTAQEKESDETRLMALTGTPNETVWSNDGKLNPKHVCGYILGVYIELNIQNRNGFYTYFQKGQKEKGETEFK